ncbi:MAG: hypothetical protein JXR63_03345 [Spirochaetales bacterium]|nr:hypothetical protein [Spirochaetales bacterium]
MKNVKKLILLALILLLGFTAFAQEANSEEAQPTQEAQEANEAQEEKKITWDPYFGMANKNDVFVPVNGSDALQPGFNNSPILDMTVFTWIGAGASLTDDVYLFFQLDFFPGFSMSAESTAPEFAYTEIYAGLGVTYTANDYFSMTYALEAAVGINAGGGEGADAYDPSVTAGFITWASFDISVPEGFFDMNLYYWAQPMWTQDTAKQVSLFNQVLYSFNFMFGNFIEETPAANFGLFYDGEIKTWGNIGDSHSFRTWNFTGIKYAPLDFMNLHLGYALLFNKNYNGKIENGLTLGLGFAKDWIDISFQYIPLWEVGSARAGADHHDFRIKLNISL